MAIDAAATEGRGTARAFVKLVRPHQWAKNVLVFVPLVASGQWTSAAAWAASALTFVAFSLVASAGYVANDLRDAREDALHPTKRHRPIASGRVSPRAAAALAPALALLGLLVALAAGHRALVVVAVYLIATLLYSEIVKRYFLADVMMLASLYTVRIVAGCAALTVRPTVWLLSLSMFVFFSLALLKRYQELKVGVDADGRLRSSRDYQASDRDLVKMLGVSSAGLAALVIAFYIETTAAHASYRDPSWLWFVCPVIWYWLARMWFKCERGRLEDDPVTFAFKDRGSWYCLVAIVAFWAFAVLGAPSLLGGR